MNIKALLFPLVILLGFQLVVPVGGQGRPPGPPPGGGRGGPPGQGGPPGGGRVHTENEAQPLDLVKAHRNPPARNEVEIEIEGDDRTIVSNGMPRHKVGRFPNRDNPNEIREQAYELEIPADPEVADRITFMHGEGRGPRYHVFGITLDGVMMEPGTAETWMGRRDSGWNYEALGGAVPLGLDTNYAHVQPDGNYHYHGLPIDLMKRLGYQKGDHSPMIGWAADGFPIYAMYGFRDPEDPASGVAELTSSYRLRKGERPRGDEGPGGSFDGAFVQDYEFVPGSGTLDECNGRYCVTPEFPDGTYAYFLTRNWPVIPRAFRGEPVQLKELGGPGGPGGPGPGRGFGPPPGGGPPPFGRPPRG